MYLRLAMLLTLMVTALTILAAFFLPAPLNWNGSLLEFQLRLVGAILIPALHVLAALFFFLGLTGFKEEFQTAYRRIAIGVIGLGFSLLASPIVTFFDLWDKWPMQYGAVCPPYIISILIIFSGVRIFFRKLEFTSIWRSPWVNASFIILIVLATILMPHTPTTLSEYVYDFGNVMFSLTAGLLFLTTFNIFAVRKHVAPDYAQVLTWLGSGLAFVALLVGPSVILKAMGIDTRDAAGNLQNLLVLAAIPYLVAGYRFYHLTTDTRNKKTQENATAIDILIYTASLSSNKQQVDTILDDLRLVTAHLKPGQPLSTTDQSVLGDVYLKLEDYLTKEERLRSFTATEVRKIIYDRFKAANPGIDQAFWNKLPLT